MYSYQKSGKYSVHNCMHCSIKNNWEIKIYTFIKFILEYTYIRKYDIKNKNMWNFYFEI